MEEHNEEVEITKNSYVSVALVAAIIGAAIGVTAFIVQIDSNLKAHLVNPAYHEEFREYVEQNFVRVSEFESLKEDVSELRLDVKALLKHFSITSVK